MARISVAGVLLAVLGLLPFIQADPWVLTNVTAVSFQERNDWCADQRSSCGLLCGSNGTKSNGCDHDRLVQNCVCADGTEPNLKLWLRTLPTHKCNWNYILCISVAQDDTWRDNCKKDILSQCGTRDPSMAMVATSTSSSAVPTPTTFQIPFSPTGTSSIVSSTPELGPIIGGAVSGLLVVIAAVASLFYWLGRRSRRRRQHHENQRSSRLPRRDRSPRPLSEIEPVEKLSGGGPVEHSIAGKGPVERTSTAISEANSGNSDDLKTLVTEKKPGHEMVKDLTESPVVEEMYFDTAKYRMPPPKPS